MTFVRVSSSPSATWHHAHRFFLIQSLLFWFLLLFFFFLSITFSVRLLIISCINLYDQQKPKEIKRWLQSQSIHDVSFAWSPLFRSLLFIGFSDPFNGLILKRIILWCLSKSDLIFEAEMKIITRGIGFEARCLSSSPFSPPRFRILSSLFFFFSWFISTSLLFRKWSEKGGNDSWRDFCQLGWN